MGGLCSIKLEDGFSNSFISALPGIEVAKPRGQPLDFEAKQVVKDDLETDQEQKQVASAKASIEVSMSSPNSTHDDYLKLSSLGTSSTDQNHRRRWCLIASFVTVTVLVVTGVIIGVLVSKNRGWILSVPF